MSKKQTASERVRMMIEKGYTNKHIIERLHVKPQMVYNIRYQLNKKRGLGAIKPQGSTGTGFNSAPTTARAKRVVPEFEVPTQQELPEPRYMPITYVEPVKTGLWTRIVNFFKGN